MPLKEGSWRMPTPGTKGSMVWKLSSQFALGTVGLFSKVWLEYINRTRIHNAEIMQDALEKRPKHQGLLTVSNHTSCIDDPLMWGTLKTRQLFSSEVMRFTSAAEDICFTRPLHVLFFSLGQVYPLVRGDGVYQKGMDFALEQLNKGRWCHFFPEGKVNMNHEFMRLKWGVGRLIADSTKTPMVIPIWHVGMDDVLPNKKPYIPRIRKQVTILFGKPMDFAKEVESLRSLQKSPREMRKYLTDKIQEEFQHLRAKAELLHNEYKTSELKSS